MVALFALNSGSDGREGVPRPLVLLPEVLLGVDLPERGRFSSLRFSSTPPPPPLLLLLLALVFTEELLLAVLLIKLSLRLRRWAPRVVLGSTGSELLLSLNREALFSSVLRDFILFRYSSKDTCKNEKRWLSSTRVNMTINHQTTKWKIIRVPPSLLQ